ncbi:MAG: hypothetical protein SGILL_009631 [Bacillariaceae sp.]
MIGKSTKKTAAVKAGKTAAKKDSGTLEEKENKIMGHLFNMHLMERGPVDETELLVISGYARADSTGYRNIMKKLKVECRYIEKSNKKVSLTEAGVKFMQAKSGDDIQKPTTNKSMEEFFKTMIIKTGKGKVPSDKLNIVWELLSDKEPHSIQEILEKTGYTRPDSTGYRAIIKGMKDSKLIEKEGKSYKFIVEKVFPFPE